MLDHYGGQNMEPNQHFRYIEQAAGGMPEESQFDSFAKQDIYLFYIASRPAVGPTQSPVQ